VANGTVLDYANLGLFVILTCCFHVNIVFPFPLSICQIIGNFLKTWKWRAFLIHSQAIQCVQILFIESAF
jgi:hypothetical protein